MVPHSYKDHFPLPVDIDDAIETIRILRFTIASVCVAVGRSKDGTGYDVDWYELARDVERLRGPKGGQDWEAMYRAQVTSNDALRNRYRCPKCHLAYTDGPRPVECVCPRPDECEEAGECLNAMGVP